MMQFRSIWDLSLFCKPMGNFKNAPSWPYLGAPVEPAAWWQRISSRVYCSCPNRRLSIYFSMNTLLSARPRLSKFICSVWFTLYRCLFVITAPECFIAGAGRKSRTTPLFFAIFPHDLFRIWSLFMSFLLQIEDAMLMFDKQTNRHRGKRLVIISMYGQLVQSNIFDKQLPTIFLCCTYKVGL